jgi:hypothetical protein
MANDILLVERVTLNQSRFRALNERMEASNASHVWIDPPMPDWVCECASEQCMVPVRLTIAQYEAVRESPTRFLVAPGQDHVVPEVERVIERNEYYWVVEKVGDAGDLSEALDHRAHAVASRTEARVLDADAIAWNLPGRQSQR